MLTWATFQSLQGRHNELLREAAADRRVRQAMAGAARRQGISRDVLAAIRDRLSPWRADAPRMKPHGSAAANLLEAG